MENQCRYSNTPGKNHSGCTCASQYFSTLQLNNTEPKTEGCQFGPNCQFDPVPTVSQYNQARCTCLPAVCICGPLSHLPVQLLQGPELDQVCCCESQVILTPGCDTNRCTCAICSCRSDASDFKLLPTDFRNAIKKEELTIANERLNKERGEIKQLLIEYEDSKKKELEDLNYITSEKSNKKPVVQKVSIQEHLMATPTTKEDTKNLIVPQEELQSPILSVKSATKKAKESLTSASRKKYNNKIVRWQVKTATQSKSATISQFTQCSCGHQMPKRKPLHVRYYYSGGTEHYGVKLGHKQCRPRLTLVPNNMGWLWNIEDPSKGIRERKGWPPGFIGKNIENMIRVLKQFDDTSEPVRVAHGIPLRKKIELKKEERQEEPPLLNIHKKGRTYHITLCPKSSDPDVGPIPIPFSITEKQRDSDSSSSDSTLEFEFHSPRPKRPQLQEVQYDQIEVVEEEEKKPMAPPSSNSRSIKKKANKTSKSTEENKILWEEQRTHIENIAC